MRLSVWLAIGDALVALGLLLTVPRQRENKVAVIAVAAVLLGVAGWLAVIGLEHRDPARRQPSAPSTGRTA